MLKSSEQTRFLTLARIPYYKYANPLARILSPIYMQKETRNMESFKEVWQTVYDYCKTRISEVAFNVFIDCISPVRLESNQAILSVRSSFQRNIIQEKYEETIRDGFLSALGFPVSLLIIATDDGESVPPEAPGTAAADNQLYEYSFDTFIIGSSNRFAYAAARGVADKLGKGLQSEFNPLFIYGNSGLGKTHLLNAICHDVHLHNPSSTILYTRGDDFTNELIDSIRNQATNEFHNKYRQVDILLVDDIQFIAGKIQTQEEFFHTFNTLYQLGKQIVLTSDRPPKEIETLEERLRTRFEWGLLADIQPPDFETRIAIVKRKAQMLDFELPEDVVQYIAERLKNNIRQLEGAVKKLKAYNILENHVPSLIIAQEAIRDILHDNQPTPITVEKIVLEVSRSYGLAPADIRSARRSATISKARQIAMYIIREVTDMSMENIGAEFGGRDHSTVVYALSQVDKNMKQDSKLKAMINDIIKNIREQ